MTGDLRSDVDFMDQNVLDTNILDVNLMYICENNSNNIENLSEKKELDFVVISDKILIDLLIVCLL